MARFLPLLLASLALALSACGGEARTAKPVEPPAPAVRESGPFGVGADRFWLFQPQKGVAPNAIVVFLHGLGEESLTPRFHRPWLRHLAAKGNAVIYPVYELGPGSQGALLHIVTAVGDAKQRLKVPFVPTVVVGYSRGARLAVEYAAVAPGVNQTPGGVLSVFPALLNPQTETQVDLASIASETRIWFMVGDRDNSVGREGVRALAERLQQGGFDPRKVRVILVVSRDEFLADHGAPLGTSAAARRAFWVPADQLVAKVTAG